MMAFTASAVIPFWRVVSGLSVVAVIVGEAPELSLVDEEVVGELAQPASSAIRAVESRAVGRGFMVDVLNKNA
jgi:hypothetical protein